jgi:hypothetical protein
MKQKPSAPTVSAATVPRRRIAFVTLVLSVAALAAPFYFFWILPDAWALSLISFFAGMLLMAACQGGYASLIGHCESRVPSALQAASELLHPAESSTGHGAWVDIDDNRDLLHLLRGTCSASAAVSDGISMALRGPATPSIAPALSLARFMGQRSRDGDD